MIEYLLVKEVSRKDLLKNVHVHNSTLKITFGSIGKNSSTDGYVSF